MGEGREIILQVLVCAYGSDAMKSMLGGSYPQVDGVGYLVSWQASGGAAVPEEFASRADFEVVRTDTVGLSRNRNNALKHACAPFCLLSDDDLSYTIGGLTRLCEYWRTNASDEDIVVCHFTESGRRYPTYSVDTFDLSARPKGYYFISVEISFRRESVMKSGVRFEELMGVGAPELTCGEEEVFMFSLLRKGLKGKCLPIILGDHPAESSGNRLTKSAGFIKTQGALLRFRYSRTWLIRLPFAAVKRARHTLGVSRWHLVMKMMFAGAWYSRCNAMFRSLK